METAVAYIRVSSQRQVDEGSSLETQTRQVQAFADLHGYELIEVFREEGESAKTDQRPELQRMLKFCRAPQSRVQVVIVPKIDRLARNVTDYTNLKVQLSRQGIRLESLGERIEDTPVGRFTETILASVAQFDNEIRAERSKGGMIEAVAQGRWVWKAPVGYRNVRHQGKGTIEPDPSVAPIIQRAFTLLANGQSGAVEVYSYLKSMGITRSESSFYRMLQNEVYLGRIHAFGGIHLARPPFTPLVDTSTFYQAQAALFKPNLPTTYNVESQDFPLRGTMLCPCSRRFTASWARGKQGKRYPYYRCPHCKGCSYPRARIENHFANYLSGFKGRPDAWDRLEAALRAIEKEQEAQNDICRTQANGRIEEIQRLQDALALKSATGIIPDEVAQRQIQRLSREMADLAGALPSDNARPVDDLISYARSFFFDLASNWQSLSLKKKKDLLRFMFPEGVLFHPESGFRTPDSSLTERFRGVISGVELHLVDHTLEIWKSLREWLNYLSGMREQVDPHGRHTRG